MPNFVHTLYSFALLSIITLPVCSGISDAQADGSPELLKIEGVFISARNRSHVEYNAISEVVAEFRGSFEIISSASDPTVLQTGKTDAEIGLAFPGDHAVLLPGKPAAQTINVTNPAEMFSLLNRYPKSKMIVTLQSRRSDSVPSLGKMLTHLPPGTPVGGNLGDFDTSKFEILELDSEVAKIQH